MDKFLLAENPMRPDKSGLFIIHMLDPTAIIECVEGHIIDYKGDAVHKYFEFVNMGGETEEWTLLIRYAFSNDFLEEPEERLPKLLDQAWRWYRSYLDWEDNKAGPIEEGEILN